MTDNRNTEAFITLWLDNQRKISAYILALVPNASDAEEIIQDTATTLWRRFDEFEFGSNFAAWGVKIAHFNILNYRTKSHPLRLSENLLNQISEVAERKCDDTEVYMEALRLCLDKLSTSDQKLLKARFERGQSVKKIAVHLSRSHQFVYKHLSRIFFALNRCISMRVEEGLR